MIKYINHVWYCGGVRKFDTETGETRRAVGKKWDDLGFEKMWKHNGKWFAFYFDDTSLLLQHKKKVWRVQANTSACVTGRVFRKFVIKENNKVVFKISYIPRGLLYSIFGPNYDALEAENDDFFLYLECMWERFSDKTLLELEEILNQ